MSLLKKYFFDSIDSTNEESKRLSTVITQDFVVVANEQTVGKGSRERSWSSEKYKGLYATYAFYKTKFAANPALISALAIVSLINAKYELICKVKWPNDVILNNKKMSGILIEKNNDYLFVGIGINLFFSESRPVTAIALSEVENINEGFFEIRNFLVDEIYLKLNEFMKLNPSKLEELFIQHSVISLGEEVKYLKEEMVFNGIFVGLGRNGEFKVRKLNGEEELLVSGDVSLNYYQ